ncbi:MAG TPA: hypothetical protein VGH44_00770 [Candidatus Saccharimonadia bacterium]|jgi:hypothetical protein
MPKRTRPRVRIPVLNPRNDTHPGNLSTQTPESLPRKSELRPETALLTLEAMPFRPFASLDEDKRSTMWALVKPFLVDAEPPDDHSLMLDPEAMAAGVELSSYGVLGSIRTVPA